MAGQSYDKGGVNSLHDVNRMTWQSAAAIVVWFASQTFATVAKQQAMLESLTIPPPLRLPRRYANAIKTLGMAILYMPALPISPILALVGWLMSCLLCCRESVLVPMGAPVVTF